MTKHGFCKIKSVTAGGYHSRLLVNFDHGCLSKEEAQEFDCSLLSYENNTKQVALVANSIQSYVGKFISDPLCQTLLLIKNKASSKARLISIPTSTLSLPPQEKQRRSDVQNTSIQDSSKRRSDIFELTQKFGSKRAKRQSELGIRMNVDMSGNAAEIQEAVSGINVDETELMEDSNRGIMEVLPPCNRSAQHVLEVYKIDDILNETERNSCKTIAQHLIDNPPVKADENHSYFICSHFKKISNPGSLDQVVFLIYADLLLKFLNTPVRDIKKKGFAHKICPFSPNVGSRLLMDFTVGLDSSRTRPNYMKDKVVCYVIVLVLLACDYMVDMNVLAPCFKGMNLTRIKQLARTVGIVPISATFQKYVLKLPLPPLPSSFGKRMKK